MGYPQSMLADDEVLLLHRHPHWKMLFWPAVIFILATGIAGTAAGFAAAQLDSTAMWIVLGLIALAWIGLLGWRVVPPFLSWRSTHFIVTDRRVLIRQGILTHSGIDIPMGRISNVQFRHGLFDRMLGTGTLIISSSDGDPLEFDDIPQVEKVHSLLYHQVFDAMQLNRDDPRLPRQRDERGPAPQRDDRGRGQQRRGDDRDDYRGGYRDDYRDDYRGGYRDDGRDDGRGYQDQPDYRDQPPQPGRR